jgi:hypothetical protein
MGTSTTSPAVNSLARDARRSVMAVVSLLVEAGHMLNQIAVTLPMRAEHEPFTMAPNLQTMLEGIRTDALEEVIRGLMIAVRETDSDLAHLSPETPTPPGT